MKAFARLLVDLIAAPSQPAKKALMKGYFGRTQDPARGYAAAALTGGLPVASVKPAMFRALAEAHVDPVLFGLSLDFVGDVAETVALVWPAPATPGEAPDLPAVVESLRAAKKAGIPALLPGLLDRLDADARWVLLKIFLGSTRVDLPERLVKSALAERGSKELAEVEEIWPGLEAPYLKLFAWLDGKAPRPAVDASSAFRPMMLAQPLDAVELPDLDPADWRAEWKWDGARVQIAAADGKARLWTRDGAEIGAAFPELGAGIGFDAVLDGELLVRGGSFADLQGRLGRRKPDAALRARLPGFVRVHDLLFEKGEDLRAFPFDARRKRLEAWHAANPDPRFELSPLVAFGDWAGLKALRAQGREPAADGLMLKRADSPYLAGRPKGGWLKWKYDARTIDAVLVYARRGEGARGAFYADFTFACWLDGNLVPVGKADTGFSDAELVRLDKFVRDHTLDRHVPVRVVEPTLVVELAFDGVRHSARHKSGVTLRTPRVARIRWDKPAADAGRVETLAALAAT
ncbi:MAG: cisplatin damage response ATP-dependent DNA ligase [Proteobacteria bacterium]|nr:cisplatin damage response ATP-dependent DNA ligase [Pseudomonadota bacterium]